MRLISILAAKYRIHFTARFNSTSAKNGRYRVAWRKGSSIGAKFDPCPRQRMRAIEMPIVELDARSKKRDMTAGIIGLAILLADIGLRTKEEQSAGSHIAVGCKRQQRR